MTRNRRAQAGFTMIELMVALVVSTLTVGMLLAINGRMSLAYRGAQQVAAVQEVIASAHGMFDADAKQAGLAMPQGFSLAADNLLHSPVRVVNSSTGPDQVAFVYADMSTQAMVVGTPTWNSLAIDANPGFAANDVVVVSTMTGTVPNPVNPGVDADIAKFDACVLQIKTIAGTTVTFFQVAPWGTTNNTHCTFTLPTPTPSRSMIYKLVAHAYRIDPDPLRAADGALQVSASGNLVGLTDWQDIGYGFTDIQVATRIFDNDLIDSDGDGDPKRDWWSSSQQTTLTAPIAKTASFSSPTAMTISVTARTDRDVEGVATTATPDLIVAGNVANNSIGDHASVSLPNSDPHLTGYRIYRNSTFQLDLRNVGVGR